MKLEQNTYKSTASDCSEDTRGFTPLKHTSSSFLGGNHKMTSALQDEKLLTYGDHPTLGVESYPITAPQFIEEQDKQRFFAIHYDSFLDDILCPIVNDSQSTEEPLSSTFMEDTDQDIKEESLEWPQAEVLFPLEVKEEECSEQRAEESEDFGDFSSRQDVLGKTMVRSLKRYYLKEFSDHNDFKTFS